MSLRKQVDPLHSGLRTVDVNELAMTDPQIPIIRAQSIRRSNRAAADYVYQAATLAAALLLLLTVTL